MNVYTKVKQSKTRKTKMSKITLHESKGSEFKVIEKPGVYKARLAILRTSWQDEKFAKKPDGTPTDPKQLISFVWDVKDKNGDQIHVTTKASSISFNEKSNLTALFKNVKTFKNQEDFEKFIYDKDDNLAEIFADVMVKVDNNKTSGKVYNTVSEIIELTEDNGVKPSELNDWDLKVYGQACDEYVLAKAYEGSIA